MAFDPLERSAALGRPEELYEFTSGVTVYRYTSADRTRWLNNYEFSPARRLRRTALKQDKDGGDDSIQVTVPGDLDIAWLFRVITPYQPMWLRIYRRHRQSSEDYYQSWYGRVRGCSWTKDGQAQLECDGLNSLFKRASLRLGYDPTCPHMLYGPGCNLDKDQWRTPGEVITWGKNFIECAEFAAHEDQWFKLGYVEFGAHSYLITDHKGSRVTTFAGIELDPTVTNPNTAVAYAGCDRLLETCWAKFDNGLNSEANPWLPHRNPFQAGL